MVLSFEQTKRKQPIYNEKKWGRQNSAVSWGKPIFATVIISFNKFSKNHKQDKYFLFFLSRIITNKRIEARHFENEVGLL